MVATAPLVDVTLADSIAEAFHILTQAFRQHSGCRYQVLTSSPSFPKSPWAIDRRVAHGVFKPSASWMDLPRVNVQSSASDSEFRRYFVRRKVVLLVGLRLICGSLAMAQKPVEKVPAPAVAQAASELADELSQPGAGHLASVSLHPEDGRSRLPANSRESETRAGCAPGATELRAELPLP